MNKAGGNRKSSSGGDFRYSIFKAVDISFKVSSRKRKITTDRGSSNMRTKKQYKDKEWKVEHLRQNPEKEQERGEKKDY